MDLVDINKTFETMKQEYESLFEETEELVFIDGKLLKDALKNQLPLEMSWELMCKKLCNLYDHAELVAETAYSDACKSVMKDKYVSYTFTEAKTYAKADSMYKNAMKTLNDIRHIRDEARGVCEVVKTRKYTLKSLSDVLIAGVENHII